MPRGGTRRWWRPEPVQYRRRASTIGALARDHVKTQRPPLPQRRPEPLAHYRVLGLAETAGVLGARPVPVPVGSVVRGVHVHERTLVQ